MHTAILILCVAAAGCGGAGLLWKAEAAGAGVIFAAVALLLVGGVP